MRRVLTIDQPKVTTLDDWYGRDMSVPRNRFEYQRERNLKLPLKERARDWLEVMEKDPELARLTCFKITRRGRKK